MRWVLRLLPLQTKLGLVTSTKQVEGCGWVGGRSGRLAKCQTLLEKDPEHPPALGTDVRMCVCWRERACRRVIMIVRRFEWEQVEKRCINTRPFTSLRSQSEQDFTGKWFDHNYYHDVETGNAVICWFVQWVQPLLQTSQRGNQLLSQFPSIHTCCVQHKIRPWFLTEQWKKGQLLPDFFI